MKKRATYAGWDFDSVWCIDEGRDYPKLRAFGKCKQTDVPQVPIENENKFDVSPNPSSGHCIIRFIEELHNLNSLKLYNSMGEELADLTASAKSMYGSHVLEINLSPYSDGAYFIVAQDRNGTYSVPIVVMR